MSPRHRLAVSLLVVAFATAGCVSLLTGSGPLAFAANATEVDDATLESTEYRFAGSESHNSTLNVTVTGQDRQVVLSSEVRRYNRTVELAPGVEGDFARFRTYTTPSPTVAGESVNPVERVDPERLVRRFAASTDGLSNVRFESNRTVRSLGSERTVSTYVARQSVSGTDTTVTVHLATVEHEDDYVVAVAVHPERVDERDRVNALFDGLVRRPA